MAAFIRHLPTLIPGVYISEDQSLTIRSLLRLYPEAVKLFLGHCFIWFIFGFLDVRIIIVLLSTIAGMTVLAMLLDDGKEQLQKSIQWCILEGVTIWLILQSTQFRDYILTKKQTAEVEVYIHFYPNLLVIQAFLWSFVHFQEQMGWIPTYATTRLPPPLKTYFLQQQFTTIVRHIVNVYRAILEALDEQDRRDGW